MILDRNEYDDGYFWIVAHPMPFADGVGIMIARRSDMPHSPLKKQILRCRWEDQETEPGEPVVPSVVMPRGLAQNLMDQLWECGLRPSAGHGSAGQLAATERHLEDMRKLAFQLAPRPR